MNKEKIKEAQEYIDFEKSKDNKYHLKRQFFSNLGYSKEQFDKFSENDFVWEQKKLKNEIEGGEAIMWITFTVGLFLIAISSGVSRVDEFNTLVSKYVEMGGLFFIITWIQMIIIGYNKQKLKKNQENLLKD